MPFGAQGLTRLASRGAAGGVLPFDMAEREGADAPKRRKVIAYWALVLIVGAFGPSLLPSEGVLGWVVTGGCLMGLGLLVYFRGVRPWWREKPRSTSGATSPERVGATAAEPRSDSMAAKRPLLVVARPKGGMGALRRVKVYVDEENVGALATRRELRLRLPAGVHTISARMDFKRGRPVQVDLSDPDEVVTVEVSTSMLSGPLPICKVLSKDGPSQPSGP